MVTATPVRKVPQHITFSDVSWDYYEQTLKQLGNQYVRIAYLDGEMELISPLPEHDRIKTTLGDLVAAVAEERRIRRKSFGSTTFRIEPKSAGSEPDESFYFGEIESITQMEQFDSTIHRAPDLWIEVDLFGTSIPREPIYARLGVPEVWRYADDRLVVRLLGDDGTYHDSATSRAFPFLPMNTFTAFIPKMIDGDETEVLLQFREWVRSLPR